MTILAETPAKTMCKYTVTAVVFLCIAKASAGVLDVRTLTKYLDPLPNPLANVITASGSLDGAPLYEVDVRPFHAAIAQPTAADAVVGLQRHVSWADF